MTEREIEAGVPLPAGNAKYRWKEMMPGDSFYVLGKRKFSGQIEHQQKLHPEKKFIFRHRSELIAGIETEVTRIWRVK